MPIPKSASDVSNEIKNYLDRILTMAEQVQRADDRVSSLSGIELSRTSWFYVWLAGQSTDVSSDSLDVDLDAFIQQDIVPVPERRRAVNLAIMAENDADAWDAVAYSVRQLSERGVAIPLFYGYLAYEAMAKQGPKKRGRPKGKTAARDFCIYNAVKFGVDSGLPATRNDESGHKRSACDVVADHVGLGFDRVKKIWSKLNKRFDVGN